MAQANDSIVDRGSASAPLASDLQPTGRSWLGDHASRETSDPETPLTPNLILRSHTSARLKFGGLPHELVPKPETRGRRYTGIPGPGQGQDAPRARVLPHQPHGKTRH